MNSDTNETFYGAMKILCEGLITKYPDKKVFFTTPLKRADSHSGHGGLYPTQESKNSQNLILKDYRDAMIDICNYYGIPVLDLWAESGLNPTIQAQQQFFSDNLHPNDAGRKRIAERVCGWITQLSYKVN